MTSYTYLLKVDGKELPLEITKDTPLVKGQTVTLRSEEVSGEFVVTDINDVFCDSDNKFTFAEIEYSKNATVLSLQSKGESA